MAARAVVEQEGKEKKRRPTLANVSAELGALYAALVVHAVDAAQVAKVRKTPSWPRSWANFSLIELRSHRNARADLTPPSPQSTGAMSEVMRKHMPARLRGTIAARAEADRRPREPTEISRPIFVQAREPNPAPPREPRLIDCAPVGSEMERGLSGSLRAIFERD